MQPLTKKNLSRASLKESRSARTVLLQMAADQERAERLKQLKADRPSLRWRQIADAVGVTERSVAEWAKTGAMSYDKAKALAVFLEVDLQWLWEGPKRQSPDLMDALDGGRSDLEERLERMEQQQSTTNRLLQQLLEQQGRGRDYAGPDGIFREDDEDQEPPEDERGTA